MKSHINYSAWQTDHLSVLEGFADKQVLIPFSGGKDSSVVLSLIQTAAEEFNFRFEAHGVFFPSQVYSTKDVDTIDGYWREKNVRIIWHDAPVSDDCLVEAIKRGSSPCLTCIETKKKLLISELKQLISDWNKVVIVMSYSLWDLVSATLEHLSGSLFADESCPNNSRQQKVADRFMETAQRFYPVLKIKGGPVIFKPLIKYNDREILEYLSTKRIPLTTTACPHNGFRPKRVFANYYEKSGLCFDYTKVFEFSKKALNLPDITYYEEVELEAYMAKMI